MNANQNNKAKVLIRQH